MPSLDPIELVFVLAIVLIILRPQRLSEAARSLGRRMGAFGHSLPPDSRASARPAAPEVDHRGGD